MNLYSFSLLSFSFGVLLSGILSLTKREGYYRYSFFKFLCMFPRIRIPILILDKLDAEANINDLEYRVFLFSPMSKNGQTEYINKQVVERNSGKVSVKLKLGKGAFFILEFPRR